MKAPLERLPLKRAMVRLGPERAARYGRLINRAGLHLLMAHGLDRDGLAGSSRYVFHVHRAGYLEGWIEAHMAHDLRFYTVNARPAIHTAARRYQKQLT